MFQLLRRLVTCPVIVRQPYVWGVKLSGHQLMRQGITIILSVLVRDVRDSHRLRECTNCHKDGHLRQNCVIPICSMCGTSWNTNKNPGYHHCDKCPHKSASVLGKRTFGHQTSPWATDHGRAHMSI